MHHTNIRIPPFIFPPLQVPHLPCPPSLRPMSSFDVCGKIRNIIRFLGVKKVGPQPRTEQPGKPNTIMCTLAEPRRVIRRDCKAVGGPHALARASCSHVGRCRRSATRALWTRTHLDCLSSVLARAPNSATTSWHRCDCTARVGAVRQIRWDSVLLKIVRYA